MEKKIRVLHVGLDHHLGGIETYLLKLAMNIDREKYQFDFLTLDGIKPCFYKELSALGCGFYNVTSRRTSYFQNRTELEKLFQTEKFDIVHCSQNSLSYITPALVALKNSCKVIIHSHNGGSLSGASVKLRHKINYYRLPKEKVTCIAVSDLAGKWMFGEKTPFIVLNNGLDTERYRFSIQAREEIRNEFGLGEEELILHIGAFRPQKNHRFLIEVFKAYHDKHNESHLLLVGDGNLRCEVEKQVADCGLGDSVIFAGLRSDIPKILSAADKYLFPSFYEGFPNALIEAESAGLYCVVADTITRQVCISGICDFLLLDVDIGAWVKALEHDVISDRETYADRVEEMGLGIKKEMENIDRLYSDVLRNKLS